MREAALELIVRALKHHGSDMRLVRSALQTVVNVLHVSERYSTSFRDVTQRSQSTTFILSYIQNQILPLALLFSQVPQQDPSVTSLCNELLTFFSRPETVESEYDVLREERAPAESVDSIAESDHYEDIDMLDR